MENGGSKFFAHLERIYEVRLGWKISVERVPQGMRVSALAECWYLLSTSQLLADRLWKRLKEAAKAVSYGIEADMLDQRRWWWTVADPVSAIRVLASFVGVTCSDAEARLVWIGL